jgi:multidrug efflux pump subunit AcrB
MNLFYRLLTDAERPEGDPLKNNYKAMRVYWHQVPGRFVTYYKLNNHRLHESGLNKEFIFQQVKNSFGDLTKVEMRFNQEIFKDVIYIFNNDSCPDKEVKSFQIIKEDGTEVPIQTLAEVTTWKEEAIKDIGGEDALIKNMV